jgi:putative oxidoreductase
VAAMAMDAKDLALVPARASLGATMLYHGVSKLRGEGPQQTGQMFEQLGFTPGVRWAKLTGLAEVFAGATAVLGIATRIGALAVLVTQGVAIAKVHRGKGFNNQAGGWEFNAALVATALALLLAGPGRISAHEAVERRLEGRGRSLFSPRRRSAVRAVKLLK